MNEKLLAELRELATICCSEDGEGIWWQARILKILSRHKHEQEDYKTEGSCVGCKDFETAVDIRPCSDCWRIGKTMKDHYKYKIPTPKPAKTVTVKGWAWVDENGLFCAYKLLPNKKTTPFHDIISSREDGYIPVTITYRLPRKGAR